MKIAFCPQSTQQMQRNSSKFSSTLHPTNATTNSAQHIYKPNLTSKSYLSGICLFEQSSLSEFYKVDSNLKPKAVKSNTILNLYKNDAWISYQNIYESKRKRYIYTVWKQTNKVIHYDRITQDVKEKRHKQHSARTLKEKCKSQKRNSGS